MKKKIVMPLLATTLLCTLTENTIAMPLTQRYRQKGMPGKFGGNQSTDPTAQLARLRTENAQLQQQLADMQSKHAIVVQERNDARNSHKAIENQLKHLQDEYTQAQADAAYWQDITQKIALVQGDTALRVVPIPAFEALAHNDNDDALATPLAPPAGSAFGPQSDTHAPRSHALTHSNGSYTADTEGSVRLEDHADTHRAACTNDGTIDGVQTETPLDQHPFYAKVFTPQQPGNSWVSTFGRVLKTDRSAAAGLIGTVIAECDRAHTSEKVGRGISNIARDLLIARAPIQALYDGAMQHSRATIDALSALVRDKYTPEAKALLELLAFGGDQALSIPAENQLDAARGCEIAMRDAIILLVLQEQQALADVEAAYAAYESNMEAAKTSAAKRIQSAQALCMNLLEKARDAHKLTNGAEESRTVAEWAQLASDFLAKRSASSASDADKRMLTEATGANA